MTLHLEDEEALLSWAAEWGRDRRAGEIVLLEGPLGAGKTTFVRGVLRGIGYAGVVRSPTFNLLQIFPTDPPILHADLYRVESWVGIGIEEYLESHLCFIEWPDRLQGLVDPESCYRIQIEFAETGRIVRTSAKL